MPSRRLSRGAPVAVGRSIGGVTHNGVVILVLGIALAVFVVPDGWQLPVIIGAAAIEVAETAFAVRLSRRGRPKAGVETLIGAVGSVAADCRPNGTVRVRGETWRARCGVGADAGQRVRVQGRDSLTLIVEPID